MSSTVTRNDRSSRVASPPRSAPTTTGRPPATAPRTRPAAAPPRRRPTTVDSGTMSAAELAQRVPFLVVLLLLIGTGVGGTLWLAAKSTQETYALRSAQEANVALLEQKEQLQTSIERSRSAEELAQRAEQLGLVLVSSAPILVRNAEGVVEIVGAEEPTLGAPVQPLQPSPVASRPEVEGQPGEGPRPAPERFEAPPAQPAPDEVLPGVDPRPDAAPPAPESVPGELAHAEPAPAPVPESAPPAGPVPAFEPVPGIQ